MWETQDNYNSEVVAWKIIQGNMDKMYSQITHYKIDNAKMPALANIWMCKCKICLVSHCLQKQFVMWKTGASFQMWFQVFIQITA